MSAAVRKAAIARVWFGADAGSVRVVESPAVAPGDVWFINGHLFMGRAARIAACEEWADLQRYEAPLAEAALRAVERQHWADDGGPA